MRTHVFRATYLTLLVVSLTPALSQDANEWSCFYPESYVRKVALTTTMPGYPPDAVQQGITGLVQAKIAIESQGKVERIRVDPKTDPLLKKAVVDAVASWTFKLRPEVMSTGRYCMSRLTFKFSLNDGSPQVELYQPGPGAKDTEHLGYSNPTMEVRQWNKWEEVQPTKSN